MPQPCQNEPGGNAMNTFERGPLTMERKVAASDPGLGGPDTLPVLRRQGYGEMSIPHGLVVSRDPSIRGALREALLHGGVAPVFATTVKEAVLDIAKRDRRFVVCQDVLRDGGYEDLLRIREVFGSSLPLIVVSRTGDWPDYFRAMERGAYDFLAYPLIPGELQRIIHNLLADRCLRRSPLLRLCG